MLLKPNPWRTMKESGCMESLPVDEGQKGSVRETMIYKQSNKSSSGKRTYLYGSATHVQLLN
jgi:hypothetical protein